MAVRPLRVAQLVVSKRVDLLETHLAGRFLHRTTRPVSLTRTCQAYFSEHCLRIVSDAEEMEQTIGRLHAEPRGLLRLSCPTSFGTLHVGPVLCGFQSQYPELAIELLSNDWNPNPFEEGCDLVYVLRDAHGAPYASPATVGSLAMASVAHAFGYRPSRTQR